jgi:hypothetical protein
MVRHDDLRQPRPTRLVDDENLKVARASLRRR